MPAKKAASKKRKSVTATRKKAAAKKSTSRKKVAKKKVSKKAPARKKVAKKKAAKKKAPVRKKAASKKKPAAKKKVAKKKPAAKKKAASKKKTVSKKKAVSRKKATSKKKVAKKTSRKKTISKKKPAAKKKSVSKKKTVSQRRTAVKTRTPAPKKAPVRRARKPGDALSGPIHGIAPYKPARGEEYMSDEQLEHFRDILSAWKAELMFEVDRTVHHMQDEAANFPDPNDRATQESEFGLELRTRDRERKLLRKIDSALGRIDDGSYGFCDETGEEIGLKRLEARPVATLSLEAQERRELAERQFRDRDDRYR
ncbi:MAG: RNA polymerase-binding protein DksA [Gammaproteobacteria bacterium]|nr:RNA polymerase-binding protein DksA [Gammaproteobacteria bacterium]